jgi:hypothetical protein
MGTDGKPAPAPVDDQARGEALEVVRDALGWTAAAELWTEIDEVLAALRAASAAGDGEAFRDATADLEALSRRRANDAGTDSGTPPPAPVRDRLNDTIHTIGGKGGK